MTTVIITEIQHCISLPSNLCTGFNTQNIESQETDVIGIAGIVFWILHINTKQTWRCLPYVQSHLDCWLTKAHMGTCTLETTQEAFPWRQLWLRQAQSWGWKRTVNVLKEQGQSLFAVYEYLTNDNLSFSLNESFKMTLEMRFGMYPTKL